jgi:sugar lactone lactonase YvrE
MPKHSPGGDAPLDGRLEQPVESAAAPEQAPAITVNTEPVEAPGAATAGEEAALPEPLPAAKEEAAPPKSLPAVAAEKEAAAPEPLPVTAEEEIPQEPLPAVAVAVAGGEEAAPPEPLPAVAVAVAGVDEALPAVPLTAVAFAAARGAEKAAADEPAAAAPAVAAQEETDAGEALSAEELEEGTAAAPAALAAAEEDGAALALEYKRRRRLLVSLGALVLLLIAAAAIFGRYLWRPGPLPELLPLPVDVNYRPHYLFSIYGVELPGGVAVSPDGDRIYVAETGGQREVKILDRDGNLLGSLAPPLTAPAERAPVYVAVDPVGRVVVSDRLQRAVFVYSPEGEMLDAILGPDLTLREYLSEQVDGLQPGDFVAYNGLEGTVLFQKAGQGEQVLPAPASAGWAPLGVRVDGQGTMLLTNVAEGQHLVREFAGEQILAASWQEFGPPELTFGTQGQGNDELLFPNTAVADSQGRIHVTDGNNGRISVWDELGTFLFTFGRGVGESALSLPRGAAMDGNDRLHVVDAVQQGVKVYDVSGPEPRFLYAFGDWGTGDGQFSFPGDIALDGTGRLYIADRENNRIQVWSY